jgi:hypothetical protein
MLVYLFALSERVTEYGIVVQAFAALGRALSPRFVDDPVVTAVA